jgi:hypothetical protein
VLILLANFDKMEEFDTRDLASAKQKVKKFQKIASLKHTKLRLEKKAPKILTKSGVTIHILEGKI